MYQRRYLTGLSNRTPTGGGKDDAVGNFSKGLVQLNKMYKKHGLNSSLIIYDNMRHEILNEVEHIKVYKDVVNFFDK